MPEPQYTRVGENPLDFSSFGRTPDYFDLGTFGINRTDAGEDNGHAAPGDHIVSQSSTSSFTYTNDRGAGVISPEITNASPISVFPKQKFYSVAGLERGSQLLESPLTVAGVALNHPHARHFSYKTQRIQLLFRGFCRWVVTAALNGAILWVLKSYSSKDILDESQKKTFNAIITGLSIALGVNIASSLRVLAQNVRWYIVSRGPRSLREFDLILGCESLIKVCQLFWEAKGRLWVRMGCATWLLVNLVMQCAVSLLGLTYNINSSQILLLLRNGNVSIADLSHWYPAATDSSHPPTLLQEQYTANSFGLQTPSFTWALNSTAWDDSQPSANLYQADDQNSWIYYYQGQNPSDSKVITMEPRTAQVTWNCTGFPVISTDNGTIITYSNNSRSETMDVKHATPGATTYVVETAIACGPRCSIVYGYQAATPNTTDADPDPASTITTSFTECHISISALFDTFDPSHVYRPNESLPDAQARIGAGAIGYQGFDSPGGDTRQYHEYQTGSIWSPQPFETRSFSGSGGPIEPNDLGWLIGLFSAGALTAMDIQNRKINVSDPALKVPYPGVELDITSWPLVYLILFSVMGAHLLLFLGVVGLANKVIVRDASELATARLLRGLVSKLGRGGCMLDGKGIARAVAEEGKVVYGVWKGGGLTNGEVWHTDVRVVDGEGVGTGYGRDFVRAWPGGLYDGEEEEDEDVEWEATQQTEKDDAPLRRRRRRKLKAD